MNYQCSVCGEHIFTTLRHRCAPVWHVRLDWQHKGEERKTFATDAQEAAEKFCERYDRNGDYDIVREGVAKVVVYNASMQLAGAYGIEAESKPVYFSHPIRLTDEERLAYVHEEKEVQP